MPSPSPSIRLLAAGAALLALAGCQSSNTVSDTERNFTTKLIFGGNALPPASPTGQPGARELGCPAAQILDGTAAFRAGDAGSARGLTYQAAINDLARECTPDGGTMRIKVGVQGRVILGENGKPGTYTIPLRVAVRGDGKTVYSRLIPTSVTIPASETQAAFVIIDEQVTLPITAEDPGEQYTILVGLDPQGQRPERRRRR